MQNTHVLFVGRPYIDFTVVPPEQRPIRDEKSVAVAHSISFGGGAAAGAFCCAKLGIKPDFIGTLTEDWLGRMFRDMAAAYGVALHERETSETAWSLIMPNDGYRAIVRCRDEQCVGDFPKLELTDFQAVHLDGHQPDAALHYAKLGRERDILTSLDGGSLRHNTDEILIFIDVAVVSERLCEQMGFGPAEMLQYLRSKGCKVGAVTLGDRGLVWYEKKGVVRSMSAIPVPSEKVVDSNGAGDIFHGAYMFSYLRRPEAPWEEHFRFATFAAAHSVQFLGIEAGLPTLANIEAAMRSRPVAVGQ